MSPHVGDLVGGKYRLVRAIGEGGMGSVFEARHEALGTSVALKFVHDALTKSAGLLERFLQEARVSAAIASPHVVHVTDVDRSPGGGAYLVMELLQGETLRRVLERERRIAEAVALDWTVQVLAGLEAAHALGVVHRDLKPDNVFVTATPHGPLLKVLDFGIAKLKSSNEWQKGLTRPGVVMGTPEYMAPEQAFASERVDARADLYAVGAMLYEMLSGRRPAEGEDAQQVAAVVTSGRVAPLAQLVPGVSPGLAAVVHRAMAADPARRFATAAEMRDALLPHCPSLSPVARMAAVATPLAPAAAPAPGPTVGAPPRVAPTWPPDDDATALRDPDAKGHTAGGFDAAAPWAAGTAPPPAYSPAPYAPASPAHAYASPAVSGGAYAVTPGAAPPAQTKRGAPLGLVAGLLGVVAVGLIAAGLLGRGGGDSEGPPPTSVPTSTGAASVAILDPPATAATVAPPQPPPTALPGAPPATATTSRPPTPHVDAGPFEAGLPDAGIALPTFDAGAGLPFEAGAPGVTIQLPPTPLGSALPIPIPTQITFPFPFPTAPPMTTISPPKPTSSAPRP